MNEKFQIRPIYDADLERNREALHNDPMAWLLLAPDGAGAEYRGFADAIRGFDRWLEEYRCRVVVRERRARANMETELPRA